jgi:hypothetical protein
MPNPPNRDGSNSIATLMVVVVGLAILIITVLTITAIVAGPPGG